MRITLLWIDRCWNCKKRVFIIKTWQFKGLHINEVNTTYLCHVVGTDCIIIENKIEKSNAREFDNIVRRNHPLYQPVRKSFKPRPAHEKRTWDDRKRMPRNFKDEDEDE